MLEEHRPIMDKLQQAMRRSTRGVEYWSARDLQALLAYEDWRNFEDVVGRAMDSCRGIGQRTTHHFVETTKMVGIGSGAARSQKDYFLTRYACYLVAMNGDPSKPQISAAQNYFAIKTREMELLEQRAPLESRIRIRNHVRIANRNLFGAAQKVGVTNRGFPIFNDAGYRGLYGGLGRAQILARKGLPKKEELLDRAGYAELAANLFRITQTEQKLEREKIRGEHAATQTHENVGKEIRATIQKIGGTMPEDLPAEDSIKQIERAQKKQLKGKKKTR